MEGRMSEFSVVTSMVDGMSARLGVISADVDELHGQASAHVSAAAQTPLHGPLSGLMGDWAAMLPHFGLAGDRLQGAMRGAAGAYRAADAAVGDAAGASQGR
jgi:hypothetical protein